MSFAPPGLFRKFFGAAERKDLLLGIGSMDTAGLPGWKRKGWRKKDGKPVLNVELLKAIDADAIIPGEEYVIVCQKIVTLRQKIEKG